jgi:hypothetical protein
LSVTLLLQQHRTSYILHNLDHYHGVAFSIDLFLALPLPSKRKERETICPDHHASSINRLPNEPRTKPRKLRVKSHGLPTPSRRRRITTIRIAAQSYGSPDATYQRLHVAFA